MAARRNSSFTPHGPRSWSRPDLSMRLRWAKSVSTFFVSFIEVSYWRVLAISQATWRASLVSLQLILRASAFRQHLVLDGQAGETSFKPR